VISAPRSKLRRRENKVSEIRILEIDKLGKGDMINEKEERREKKKKKKRIKKFLARRDYTSFLR
jgi:hypothetical protein